MTMGSTYTKRVATVPLIAKELARISVLIKLKREQRTEMLKTEDLFRDEFAT